MLLRTLFVAIAIVVCTTAQAQDCTRHGVPVGGHPTWEERSVLVWSNACRMAPQEYRDEFLNGADVLGPDWYSPVNPVVWHEALGRSALAHSTDLANTPGCPFQHDSCDGTNWITRVGSYYKKWRSLGENCAGGYVHPLSVVNALLLDASGGVPAPDASPGDGHRRAIMSSIFYHMGAGFATGPNPMLRYWTQDFGRNQPAGGPLVPCSPLIAGTHTIEPSGAVAFAVNYWGPAPSGVFVVVDGVRRPMALYLGDDDRGTYWVDGPGSSGCRSYHFEAGGWRYPVAGELRTFGDGCGENYRSAIDFNGDGAVTFDDIFDFLNGWLGSDARADFDRDGELTTMDIFDFVNAWMAG